MFNQGKSRSAIDRGPRLARDAKYLAAALRQTLTTRALQAGVVAGLLFFSASALSAAQVTPADPAAREQLSQLSGPVGKASLAIAHTPGVLNAFPTAWWNWIFVSLFAFFGCGQFVLLLYQSNVIGKTLAATQKAADVAERTAAEFETPFLFPVLVSSTVAEDLRSLQEEAVPDMGVSPQVCFTIKNFGRTPALLQRASAVFFVGELEEAHNDPVSGRLPELMLEPLGSLILPLERAIDRPIDRAVLESVKNQNARIYLRGRITFLDVLGNRYEQIFCFTWDMETG